jgi:4a-hydroxytetrahydrobiopterin dehydratase
MKCKPCTGSTPPLTEEEIKELLQQVKNWKLEGKKLVKKFKFKYFVQAMKFINKIAEIAEEEEHHPDIEIHYNRVTLTIWTHAINNLSENDFILAAKIDGIAV